ncbi:MAG: SPOR domain-containing protein [Terriglobales bacterium]
MPTATSEDTEITLGTGKMLALFFGLVALCAVFFGFGFSLGKNSVLKPSAAEASAPAPLPAAILRPSAVKTESTALASSADAVQDKAPDTQTPPATTPAAVSDTGTPAADANSPAPETITPPTLNGYYVQVAAVSKQEDADALVDALKKKQYPAFSANTDTDKLFHVQLGPYGDIKDAETMRAKLVSDGYNPILKK